MGYDTEEERKEEMGDDYHSRQDEAHVADCNEDGKDWMTCTTCWIIRIRKNGMTNKGC